jgi:hypothetical protein
MSAAFLEYDPGPLPTRPAPLPGERAELWVDGWPPWKDEHFSIRNVRSPQFRVFTALRRAAIHAMGGRAWYLGPVRMELEFWGPATDRKRRIDWYAAGVEDALDGGHGETFTYLPIVFEDDCQIVDSVVRFHAAPLARYRLAFDFLSTLDPQEDAV